jgi:hypothetical protein
MIYFSTGFRGAAAAPTPPGVSKACGNSTPLSTRFPRWFRKSVDPWARAEGPPARQLGRLGRGGAGARGQCFVSGLFLRFVAWRENLCAQLSCAPGDRRGLSTRGGTAARLSARSQCRPDRGQGASSCAPRTPGLQLAGHRGDAAVAPAGSLGTDAPRQKVGEMQQELGSRQRESESHAPGS